MAGITSSVGLASGLPTKDIIDQLMSAGGTTQDAC